MDLGTDATSEIPRLVKALGDDHPRVQTAAARALGSIGDSSATEPLITNMADKDRKVRLWTWKALVQIGDPAIEALITHLGKNTPTRALSYVNEAGNKISLLIEIRNRMPSFGARAVPALIAGLENKDSWTRTNSANILGEIGPPAKEAIHALVIALDDDYDDCRFRAVQALGKIGDLDPMVMPALDKASKDKSKKIANRAKHAIKTIKAEQAKKKGKKKAREKAREKAKAKKKVKKKGKS
jgi:HEAT repeat protein